MDPVTAVITGLGLAGAAGLNAYVPLLVVGLLGRAGILHLTAPYDSLTDTPVLVVLGVLFAIEFLADKVPGVDSVNDVVQTVVRPAAGAVLMAGSLGIGTDLPPWVGVVAGIITAGGIHATKAAARPVLNVSTAGVGGPVVSLVEDAVALAASLLAVLAPILLVVVVAALVWWLRRLWLRRREARAIAGLPTSGA
ncbi:MAG TPA: DUF4126 domain-containing protein [Candidatus Nanopelagicales bacterium]|nr:DUF4126 domain-containing protein [Candidatus Nanopelagicales bacterium]